MNFYPWPSFVLFLLTTTTLPLHFSFLTLSALTNSSLLFIMKRVRELLAKLIPPLLPFILRPHPHVSSVVVLHILRRTATRKRKPLRMPNARPPIGVAEDVVAEEKAANKMPRKQRKPALKLEMWS